MRNKHLIFGLGVVLLFLGSLTSAQAQQGGIGLRLGGHTAGISGKYFMRENLAFEGILGTGLGRRGFQLTGLIELHAPAFDVPGLEWFYGGGAHVGFFRGRYYHKRSNRHYEESFNRTLTTVGVDAIVGLEYQITEIPVSLSLDFKPFFEGNRDGLFLYGDGALTVRYTF